MIASSLPRGSDRLLKTFLGGGLENGVISFHTMLPVASE